MRKFFEIASILLGIALVILCGVVYCISTKVENGLVDPVLIPFVSAQLVIIVLLIVFLIVISVSSKKE